MKDVPAYAIMWGKPAKVIGVAVCEGEGRQS